MKEQNTKKKPVKENKWRVSHLLGYGLFGILVIHFLYVASKRTIENFRLAENGVLAKAFVASKQSIGGKGTIEFTLKYKVNGVRYINEFTNEQWSVGDSVDIVYLTEDPTVIRSFRFISDNYSTDLKLE